MIHDPSKVLMGSTQSSDRVAETFNADPATFKAGLAVRNGASGLGVAVATGQWLGISLGKSLSDHKKTAVCRVGSLVPIQLTDESDYDYVVKGETVHIDDVTGLACPSGGTATESAAIYRSGVLDGVMEDGTEVKVALVDIIGGL